MKKTLPLLLCICCFISTINATTKNENDALNSIKKANSNTESIQKSTADLRPKFRIGFDAPQITHRQLLLTIDPNATDGVDWGYDGEIPLVLADDMYWLINDNKYVIQATNKVTANKEIALGIVTANGGAIKIKVDAVENPIEGLFVGLKDSASNIIHNLQESDYQITLPAGEYHNRFSIVFLSNETVTSPPPPEDTIEDNVKPPVTDDTTDEPITSPPPPGDTIEDNVTPPPSDDTTNGNETPPLENDTEEEGNQDENNEVTEETVVTETETTTDDDENEEIITKNNHGNSGNHENHFNRFNKQEVVIYVNNGQNSLNIKNKDLISITKVTLFSQYGQKVKVWTDNLKAENLELSVQAKSGFYIVIVETENGPVFKRIMIQNS